MTDFTSQIAHYISLVQDAVMKLDKSAINEAMNILEDARARHADIYICGNGGSAATASHFLCDFNKSSLELSGNNYHFTCLSDNVPMLTALSNDYDYSQVFLKQIEGRIRATDLLICISGSGNSPNVLLAAEYAQKKGSKVLALTGYDGGKLYKMADYNLHAPIDNMQVAEDIHMIFDHMMIWILCETLKSERY